MPVIRVFFFPAPAKPLRALARKCLQAAKAASPTSATVVVPERVLRDMLPPTTSVHYSYVQLATEVSICGTHPTASESYTVLPSAVMVIVVTDPAVRALYDHIGRSEPKLPKNSTYIIGGHGWNMQSVSGGVAIIKAVDFNRHTLSFSVLKHHGNCDCS